MKNCGQFSQVQITNFFRGTCNHRWSFNHHEMLFNHEIALLFLLILLLSRSCSRCVFANSAGLLCLTVVGGGFLLVVTCLWRCGFARPEFVLGRSTRNSTLGRIDQWLPMYFWAYKIDKTQSCRIMIMVEINNMISMIALIKWWVDTLLLCILSDVQY